MVHDHVNRGSQATVVLWGRWSPALLLGQVVLERLLCTNADRVLLGNPDSVRRDPDERQPSLVELGVLKCRYLVSCTYFQNWRGPTSSPKRTRITVRRETLLSRD